MIKKSRIWRKSSVISLMSSTKSQSWRTGYRNRKLNLQRKSTSDSLKYTRMVISETWPITLILKSTSQSMKPFVTESTRFTTYSWKKKGSTSWCSEGLRPKRVHVVILINRIRTPSNLNSKRFSWAAVILIASLMTSMMTRLTSSKLLWMLHFYLILKSQMFFQVKMCQLIIK